jgi:hypothetical protein
MRIIDVVLKEGYLLFSHNRATIAALHDYLIKKLQNTKLTLFSFAMCGAFMTFPSGFRCDEVSTKGQTHGGKTCRKTSFLGGKLLSKILFLHANWFCARIIASDFPLYKKQ